MYIYLYVYMYICMYIYNYFDHCDHTIRGRHSLIVGYPLITPAPTKSYRRKGMLLQTGKVWQLYLYIYKYIYIYILFILLYIIYIIHVKHILNKCHSQFIEHNSTCLTNENKLKISRYWWCKISQILPTKLHYWKKNDDLLQIYKCINVKI